MTSALIVLLGADRDPDAAALWRLCGRSRYEGVSAEVHAVGDDVSALETLLTTGDRPRLFVICRTEAMSDQTHARIEHCFERAANSQHRIVNVVMGASLTQAWLTIKSHLLVEPVEPT